MNYYRRYVGDYLRDTSRLSVLEHGAYGLLLDYYYAEERPIPLDQEEVFRMVRAIQPGERKAIEKVLAAYFDRRADGYHNARADHEIEVSRKARENGTKGGRPPTGSETGSPTDEVTGTITGSGTGEWGGSGHPPASSLQPPADQPSTANSQPREKAAGRGARLPADWKPDSEQVDFCKAERPDLNPETTAARFRDYWIAQPGAKGRKVDWPATWRNWVRNEKRINGSKPSVAEANRLAGEEAQRRFEEEQRAGR